MKALIKIINTHFWKSILGPFFAFGFPIIFIAILGTLLGYAGMFGGLIIISSMSVSLTSMPQAIFEFKNSTLLKRIGVTPIKPWMFLLTATIYYTIIMIIATFFAMACGILIFIGNMDVGKQITKIFVPPGASIDAIAPLVSYSFKTLLSSINWGTFTFSLLLNILVGTSLGLFLVAISKSIMTLEGISVPVLIISEFLAAQALPLDMVRDIDAIWYLGYITPFKSTTALMFQSLNPSVIGVSGLLNATASFPNGYYEMIVTDTPFNFFDLNSIYYVANSSSLDRMEVFSYPERILNLILPFIWIIFFSGLTIKFFKWSTRG